MPLPSADTPTFERWLPAPAGSAGSMSSGAPTGLQVVSISRLTRTSPPPVPGTV